MPGTGFPLLDLFQGYAQAKTDAAEAQQAGLNARDAGIKSVEIAEQSQEQLRRTLGNIDSLQTARGVDLASPTAMAIDSKATADSDRNQAIGMFGALQQQQGYLAQQRGYTTAEEWAIPLGAATAANDTASLVSQFG